MTETEKIIEALKNGVLSLFGERLVSLAVYGSAATADFLPGTSDVNAALVLTEVGLPEMQQAQGLREKLKKARLAAPLLLTEEFIRTSADVFPIEFLEIKEKHRLLAGKDLFSRLKIDLKNLRHECEHELKGRVLRLRQSFVEVGSRPAELQALLVAAHSANYPAFRTVLRLKKVKPPVDQTAILEEVGRSFKLDTTVLCNVRRLRRGEMKLQARELTGLFEQYLGEVEKLAQAVDRL
jgi:hypothetical protein